MVSSILGMGNPLLDISAVVDQEFLDKYQIKLDNAILSTDLADQTKVDELYKELSDTKGVEYIAGGATQNSIRVAQWMLSAVDGAGATTYMGCVGDDAYAKTMQEKCAAAGVAARYYIDKDTPTGTCAVCIKDGERSLVANLSAANNYKPEHMTENWEAVKGAQICYSAGFFLTVAPGAMLDVAKHCVAEGKTYCLNLAAPFLMQVPPFKEAMMKVLPFTSIVFGNESEAVTFAETEGWEERDVAAIAQKLADMPFDGEGIATKRMVVFTQGSEATVVASKGEELQTFAVAPLEKDQLVDTNGAGDAFVGGFLAGKALGKDIAKCVEAGHYAARVIIQRSGCTYPDKPEFAF